MFKNKKLENIEKKIVELEKRVLELSSDNVDIDYLKNLLETLDTFEVEQYSCNGITLSRNSGSQGHNSNIPL